MEWLENLRPRQAHQLVAKAIDDLGRADLIPLKSGLPINSLSSSDRFRLRRYPGIERDLIELVSAIIASLDAKLSGRPLRLAA
jgi:hypothetical protein